jgi:Ni2+-binding GTPase involved in maturation of urease and hydrogenase
VRVVSIIGAYGTGKSTCIEMLVRAFADRDVPIGVVVNDQGMVNLEELLSDKVPLEAIGGG